MENKQEEEGKDHAAAGKKVKTRRQRNQRKASTSDVSNNPGTLMQHHYLKRETNPGPSIPDMPSITVTLKGVLDLLKAIVPGKAFGPDNIPAKVLKECASPCPHGILPAVTSRISCP